MPRWNKTLFDRFGEKIERNESGCWLWMAGVHLGYALFSFGGKTIFGHRFAYEAFRCEIPKGLQIDHLCRNRRCVNPFHMQAVTQRENILRGIGLPAENAKKTHCLRGHPFNESNTFLKRSRGRVQRICRTCNIIKLRELRKRTRARLAATVAYCTILQKH